MSLILFTIRSLLAALVVYVLVVTLFVNSFSPVSVPHGLSALIISGLLALTGFSLVMGWKTKIMATFSVAYLTVYVGIMLSHAPLDPIITYAPVTALAFSIPLVLFGGGRITLPRRGISPV